MMIADKPQETGNIDSISLWRDRKTFLTGGLLLLATLFAWVVVIRQSAQMQSMSEMDMNMPMTMSRADPVFLADAFAYVGAWGVMMAAMMLPSAFPMIALYGAICRNFSQTQQYGIPTWLFVLIYLLVWLVVGIPIYAASVVIESLTRNNPTAAALVPYGVALILVVAGAYQFAPLKRVCLRVCQSPMGFLMSRWRSGYINTAKMAFDHAIYCVGCCWGLMVILVAAGAMALHWVLLIAIVVFAEKLLPYGEWTTRIVGGGLILLGILVAVQPALVGVLQGVAS